MRTIWKFPLAVTDVQTVTMPAGAAVLHVGVSDRDGVWGQRTPTLWASVDPHAPVVERVFAMVETGHPAPEPGAAAYVGTVMQGQFVWHVFEQPS